LPTTDPALPLDNIAHVIQVALTPMFLLTAVGTLLNVFNTRLSRVIDHSEHLADLLRSGPGDDALLKAHLRRLTARTLALDAAIGLLTLAGASTCAAALFLFLGTLRDASSATTQTVLFGAALLATVAALAAFFIDSILAWHGLFKEGPMPKVRSAGH
jgi:Protein of unknown function (DUF2721)